MKEYHTDGLCHHVNPAKSESPDHFGEPFPLISGAPSPVPFGKRGVASVVVAVADRLSSASCMASAACADSLFRIVIIPSFLSVPVTTIVYTARVRRRSNLVNSDMSTSGLIVNLIVGSSLDLSHMG